MSETPVESEAATTGSGAASLTNPAARPPPAIARKPDWAATPLKSLTAKHKLLISYMVVGCPHPYITAMTRAAPTEDDPDARRPLNQNEPLRLEEAADALGIRRRHARHLFEQVVFQKALSKELNALRDGAKARAMHRIIALVDEPGEGKAADRKVQLQAAQALLGEAVGAGPAQVNVGVTVNNQLTAGIVVRIPSAADTGSGQAGGNGSGKAIDVAPAGKPSPLPVRLPK